MSETPTASSVPAQGGMGAQDPVAESNERVRHLKAKEKVLEVQITGLEEYCYDDTSTERRAELKTTFKTNHIDVNDVAAATAKLVDLKNNLDSVNAQLVSARKDLATTREREAQAPQDGSDALLTMFFEFGLLTEGSEGATTPASILWPDGLMENAYCWVCWATTTTSIPLSRAHILRHESVAKQLHVTYGDEKNMLVLCGGPGQQGTCHDLFDSRQMCFVQHGHDSTTWFVCSGRVDLHGTEVVFPNSPYRRALRWHTYKTYCNLLGVEEGDKQKWSSQVRAWLQEAAKNTSPLECPETETPGQTSREHTGGRGNGYPTSARIAGTGKGGKKKTHAPPHTASEPYPSRKGNGKGEGGKGRGVKGKRGRTGAAHW
eukprot:Rhum_TRINITY_DN15448_c2_g1::Rhum_TRINITY_DN15448_c2_g1_i8::g.155063::m.155063